MTYRIAPVVAKMIALRIPATTALLLTVVMHAVAQQPSTNLPASPTQATPDAGRARVGAPGDTEHNGRQPFQLTFSPWTRYCATGLSSKSSDVRAKGVCFTAADGHLQSGEKLVIALLIEPDEGGPKLLRVTLPLGVALVPGARIVIDEKEALVAPYVVCLPKNGCMADYEADADLITKLKKGRTLMVQGVDKGHPISFSLPLIDFAKAYDGPPSDPTGLDEKQRILQNEQ